MIKELAVTVLICTRDRGEQLARALESLTHAFDYSPGIPLEAVIVDNGSADETAAIIESWRKTQRFSTVMVFDPIPGLARARNAGLHQARGHIIAMTDDDCCLHADYFTKLIAAFEQEQEPTIIGGRIELGDPEDLEITVKTHATPMTLAPTAFPAGFVMGANLAMTASVIEKVGLFDDRFGAGARFKAAEDTDFLLRAMAAGIRVKYDPTFAVDHFHGRKEIGQIVQLSKGYYFGDGALYAKHLFRDRRIARSIVQDLRRALYDVVRPSTSRHGIRRLGLFKAHHRLKGFLAYFGSSR